MSGISQANLRRVAGSGWDRRSGHRPATRRKTVSQYARSTRQYGLRSSRSGGARPLVASEEILPVRHYDWIAHFGRRTPDKLAAVDLASERRFSYAQFDARISRLAAHLRDRLKIRRGDRVAVLAMNHRYAGGAIRVRTYRRGFPALEYPPHRHRASVHC